MLGLCILAGAGNDKMLGTVTGRPDEHDVGYVSCLYFSSSSAVLEFLNVSGNAALLDGPIFRIEGLLTEDDGGSRAAESGGARDIFAIPTGIGRLLTDYRKLPTRGVANVGITVSPEAGLNDGLLSLRIRTHNQCGVSARAALVCDFGEGWSKDSAVAYLAASPSKRLRGALEACFMEQAKSFAPSAVDPPQNPKPEVQVVPLPTGKMLAEHSKRPTPGDPPKDGKRQKIDAKVATVPAQTSASSEAPAAASPPPAAPPPAVPAAPAALASGGLEVCIIDDWAVTVADSKLQIRNLRTTPRKLPSKSVLHVWRGGRMEDGNAGVKEFVVAKSSELIVTGDNSKGQISVTSLASYVAANALTGVYQHGKFPPGHAPSTLVCKKPVGYVPAPSEASILPAVVTAMQGASNSKLIWMVAKAEDKVAPVGIALISVKQMIVQGLSVATL